MILPDWHIAMSLSMGEIVIDPIDVDPLEYESREEDARQMVEDSEFIQPSSCDIELSNDFIVFDDNVKRTDLQTIDPMKENDLGKEIIVEDTYTLDPGEFVLGNTKQTIMVPDNLRATVEGRSSWGRLAITVHVTAGYIDPGYGWESSFGEGNVTLEISNLNNRPVELIPESRFCQLEFAELKEPSHKPYCGKYSGQRGVQKSRVHEDFE